MAKSKNKKKQNPKQNNKKKSNYDLIIAFILFFVAILNIFQAGYFGILISDLFAILFGDAAIAFSMYMLLVAILIITKKLKSFYASIYGAVFNLILFTIMYLYHIYYLFIASDVVAMAEYKNIALSDAEFLGSGIIIHGIDRVLFTFFGGVGIVIPAALLIVVVGLLTLKMPLIDKIEERMSIFKKDDDNDIGEIIDIEKTQVIEEVKPSLEPETPKPFDDILNAPFESNIDVTTTSKGSKSNDEQKIKEEMPFSALAFKKSLLGIEQLDETNAQITSVPNVVKNLEEEIEEELVITPSKKIKPPVGKYSIPPLDLLKSFDTKNKNITAQNNYANEKAEVLLSTLASFKINAKMDKINIGPNIIKYELIPEVGTKVARFSALNNDIALALAASSVRIEAPIPGKSAIGIEIPNQKPKIIGLKEVLSAKNNDKKNLLQVGLGVDITGTPIFCDIKTTPHMLVAGSTGSGKSVCINSIIVSILSKARPEEVKLVLVDPKKVELTPFNGIPHLLTPVVTDPKKAAYILKKMVEEMENRYELFAETNTRNISSYNEKTKDKLPYIVIIIDELADLMMVASKEVESSIARLAQMARACGIHLIIATQRPSTDVITGLIKANIPTRISFAVSSSIDSRTILDSMGAEKLLGKGDMLIMEQTSPNLKRLQGAFLTDEEVYGFVDFINSQDNEVTFVDFDITEETQVSNETSLDPLYNAVKNDVISMQKASTSYIQRQYKVGYNRATTIMQQLESRGVISKAEGTKPRRVLVREEDADLY